MHNATGQMTPPPRVASTEYYRLDDDGDVLAARPTPLVEVRPQPGVLRHTGRTSWISRPSCRSSMILCRRWGGGGQVVEFMRKLDAPALDEQVIAVPKISLDRVSKRCPRPRTRRADRLVEVPAIISCSSLHCSGLPSRSLTFQFLKVGVDGACLGGLQCVSQRQGSTALCGADLVDLSGSTQWRSSWFPPRTGFNGFVLFFARACWCRG